MNDYLTESDIINMNNCHTIGELFKYLDSNFDLNLVPSNFHKKMIVSGLVNAVEILKPIRKIKRKRILN